MASRAEGSGQIRLAARTLAVGTRANPLGRWRRRCVTPALGGDRGRDADERRTIAEMMAKGTYAMLLLATKDLDGVFAKLQAGGAEIVEEPTEQPYGIRDCSV